MLIRTTGIRATVAVVVLLVNASCNQNTKSSGKEDSSIPDAPVKQDRVIQMSYSAEIDGGFEVSFSQKIPVRVLTLTSENPDFVGLSLLSVGPSEPLAIGTDRWFRIAFDLMRFEGNGKYRIRAGSPRDLLGQVSPSPGQQVQAPDQSNVLVQYWTVKPAVGVEPQTFNHALEPCPVEVSKEGLKGTLRCSEITDDNASALSIVMHWG